MSISTRTIHGTADCCPQCNTHAQVQPWQPYGDLRCEKCGQLMWFVNLSEDVQFFDHESSAPLRQRLYEIVARHLKTTPEHAASITSVHQMGIDSLGMIELAMDLEEGLKNA